LHLVGYLYYWQMGFNSVFKGLIHRGRDFLFPAYSCLCPVSPVTVSRLFSPRDSLEICGLQDLASVLEGDDNHMNSMQDFVLDRPGSSDIKLYAT
jgi:hypothetical protein